MEASFSIWSRSTDYTTSPLIPQLQEPGRYGFTWPLPTLLTQVPQFCWHIGAIRRELCHDRGSLGDTSWTQELLMLYLLLDYWPSMERAYFLHVPVFRRLAVRCHFHLLFQLLHLCLKAFLLGSQLPYLGHIPQGRIHVVA